MADYSMIFFAFILGGIAALVVVRIIVRIFDKLESVPLKMRLAIAFIVLTAGSGLTEIFVSGEGWLVAMAFSLGFSIVIFLYELPFTDVGRK